MHLLTVDDVREEIRRELEENHIADWAAENNLSVSYVYSVLNKSREPGRRVLDALGLKRVSGYVKK